MPNPDEERGIQYADGGVGDGRVFYPNPERIQQFHDEWDAVSTTDPTAETLPTTQEPNPFTCTVDIRHVGKYHEVWLTLANDDMWWALEEFLMGFSTKEEADTHAALILAALHQAVME